MTSFLDSQISVFKNGKSITPETRTIKEVLDTIRSDKFKDKILKLRGILKEDKTRYAEQKKLLPAFSMSALLSTRAASVPISEKLLGHSGLCQIDFDGVEDAASFRREIDKDKYTAFSFFSPSGSIKAAIRVDPAKHLESFLAAQKYYLEKYGRKIDPSVKDIPRLCFMSWDPDVYVNEEAPVMPISTRMGPSSQTIINRAQKMVRESTEGEKHVKLRDAAELLGGYVAGAAIGVGEAREALRSVIRERGDVKSYRDADQTIDRALSHGQTRPIYADISSEPSRRKIFYKCTDLGNAERFAAQWRGSAVYCHPWGDWFVWDGAKWARDESGKIFSMAKVTVRSIYQEAKECENEDIREAIAKWGIKSEAQGKIAAMVALAQSEEGIPVHPVELDRDIWLYNCKNGTLNLKNGAFIRCDPWDRITKVSGCEVDLNAECPTWKKFLGEVLGQKPDLVQFVQRAVGYSLTGDVSEHCLFFLHGTGRNGKSTFLEVLAALFGDYAKHASFETFIEKKNEAVRNDIADLRGARIVIASEAEKGQRLAESLIKNMTGGEAVKARFLFKEHFEFIPTFKIWLAANHKPIIRGTDPAIWARIKLLPFTVRIPDEKMDRHLKDKLLDELPGIFNWAAEGYLEWKNSGLGTCEDVACATAGYRAEMDILGAFFEERCHTAKDAIASKGELYSAYEKWCEHSGERCMSKRAFGMAMIERGVEDAKEMGVRFWKGVGLLDETE